MIEHKTTHVDEAVANLIQEYKHKPKLTALLTAYINSVQELEDIFFDLYDRLSLANAIGAQIDGFGSIVGEAREGRNDIDYKAAIRARIILNYSHGTCEDIIALLQAVCNVTRIRASEFFPAGFMVQIVDPVDPDYVSPTKIQNIVDAGRGAGIRGITLFGTIGAFRYDSGPGYDVGHYGGAVE